MAQKRKRDKDNGGRREDGAPSGAKGRKRKYVNPLDKYFSSDLETKSPKKGKSHPTSGTHSKSEHVASSPARQKPQKGKLIKSFHDSTKSSQSRVERKGKKLDSPHAFSSVDSEPVTPRNGKSHPTSEANFGRGDGPPLLTQNRAQKSTKLFRTLLYSPRSAPSSVRGKGGDTNDISQSSSRDFEIAPPRKRKRHPTNEADFGGEEALTPPPKKKSLNSRLAKGVPESAQGGPSRAYHEVKEVNDFEESPPRHSKIGHQAKDEKRPVKKLDSKSEDVTLATDKKKAQDASVVKSLSNSAKGGPGRTKGKTKEARDPSESSPRDSETGATENGEKHPASGPYSDSEYASSSPAQQGPQNDKFIEGFCDSPKSLSGASRNRKYANDLSEASSSISEIGPPGKCKRLATNEANPSSDEGSLTAKAKGTRGGRFIKSPHHYVQTEDAVAGGCLGDTQQDKTLNLPLPEKAYGGADDPEIQSQVKTPPKPYNYFDSLVEPPKKIYLPPDRYAQHLAKLEKEKLFKEFTTGPKAWEKRKLHQRGPRAGRSDEFNTEEEAQYAENIIREATRRRLETWHRERHEMWGLKKVQLPEKTYQDIEASEQEDSEQESEEEGSEVEEEDPEPKTQVAQEDQKDDATVQDILQGIPKPLDPCFNSPADIVFLPRTAKFNEVVFQLEYHRGYTRKQVLWLMGGAREGRDPVPSANTLGMRLLRYMKKNKLTDTVKVAPAGTVAKPTLKAYHGDDKGSGDDAEQERPLLPHGPRIRSRELGVHSWFWDHPHEILQKKIYGRTYTTLE